MLFRSNQYIRFYPTKGRRIKKIRGYVRLKDRSETKALDECCDDENLVFEAAYSNHPYYITYMDIIETISLHLSILRFSYKFSYNAVERELIIYFKDKSTKVQLDEIITTILNLKSERKSLIDYVRRTIWIKD